MKVYIKIRRDYNKYHVYTPEDTITNIKSYELYDLGEGTVWNEIYKDLKIITENELKLEKLLKSIIESNSKTPFSETLTRKLDYFISYSNDIYVGEKEHFQIIGYDTNLNIKFCRDHSYLSPYVYRLDIGEKIDKNTIIIPISKAYVEKIRSLNIKNLCKKRYHAEEFLFKLVEILTATHGNSPFKY